MNEGNSLTKVFVGGLPWSTEDIYPFFSRYGEIIEAVVIHDKVTGKSKGYGFVTFRDPEAARKATRDPSPIIDGRRANCNLAAIGAKGAPPNPEEDPSGLRNLPSFGPGFNRPVFVPGFPHRAGPAYTVTRGRGAGVEAGGAFLPAASSDYPTSTSQFPFELAAAQPAPSSGMISPFTAAFPSNMFVNLPPTSASAPRSAPAALTIPWGTVWPPPSGPDLPGSSDLSTLAPPPLPHSVTPSSLSSLTPSIVSPASYSSSAASVFASCGSASASGLFSPQQQSHQHSPLSASSTAAVPSPSLLHGDIMTSSTLSISPAPLSSPLPSPTASASVPSVSNSSTPATSTDTPSPASPSSSSSVFASLPSSSPLFSSSGELISASHVQQQQHRHQRHLSLSLTPSPASSPFFPSTPLAFFSASAPSSPGIHLSATPVNFPPVPSRSRHFTQPMLARSARPQAQQLQHSQLPQTLSQQLQFLRIQQQPSYQFQPVSYQQLPAVGEVLSPTPCAVAMASGPPSPLAAAAGAVTPTQHVIVPSGLPGSAWPLSVAVPNTSPTSIVYTIPMNANPSAASLPAEHVPASLPYPGMVPGSFDPHSPWGQALLLRRQLHSANALTSTSSIPPVSTSPIVLNPPLRISDSSSSSHSVFPSIPSVPPFSIEASSASSSSAAQTESRLGAYPLSVAIPSSQQDQAQTAQLPLYFTFAPSSALGSNVNPSVASVSAHPTAQTSTQYYIPMLQFSPSFPSPTLPSMSPAAVASQSQPQGVPFYLPPGAQLLQSFPSMQQQQLQYQLQLQQEQSISPQEQQQAQTQPQAQARPQLHLFHFPPDSR